MAEFCEACCPPLYLHWQLDHHVYEAVPTRSKMKTIRYANARKMLRETFISALLFYLSLNLLS